MKTGLRKQLPQKRQIQRPSGEQDVSVGASPRFGKRTVIQGITNVESITSHSYIKDVSAKRGGFAIYKDSSNKFIASFDELKIRGNWKINATSIYTGTEDHSGYTTNAGDITIYSDGTNASIHAKNFYIDSSGNIVVKGGTVGGWSLDDDAIYTGTKDASGYTSSGVTLSSASGGSIHAKLWYIDTAGKAYLNTGNFSGAITSAATITGGTFQTASSGQRVVITSTSIAFYPASGSVATLYSDSSARIYTSDAFYAQDLHTTNLRMTLPTMTVEVTDAARADSTEQDWISVTVGGNLGYVRVYATK